MAAVLRPRCRFTVRHANDFNSLLMRGIVEAMATVHPQRVRRSRSATTRTCSPPCARSSTSPAPRTAARRRASAAAARCSSTARRSIACTIGLDQGRGQDGHHPRGPRPGRARALRRPPSPPPARCSAGSARPASSCAQVPARQGRRRRSPATRRPATSAATCAAAPATTRSSTPSTCWPPATRPRCPRPSTAGDGRPGRRQPQRASTRPTELALGDKPYVDDLRVPGMLHAAVVLAEHARADVLAIDTPRPRPSPGVVRVLTAADVPGELRIGLIHRDWPVFIPVGGRTSYTGDVLALVVADDRATARAGRRAGARSSTAPLAPDRRRRRRACDRAAEDAVWGARRQRARRAATYARRRRRRRPRRQRPRRPRGVPDPAHRARLPRAGVDARRAPRRRHARGVLRRPGRVGRPPPDRRRARRRRGPGARAPRRQRRRLRRQGGLRQPDPDRPRRPPARAPGEVHAQPGGVAAASTRSATPCASRRGRAATPTAGSPRSRSASSATRAPTPRWG